jgi:hypothetical protein
MFIGLVNVSKAGPDSYFVNAQVLGRNVLFKGDSVSIRVDSNASQVQLNIYDSANKNVYSSTVTANTTTVFSVPATYGLFTVKASVLDRTATTWFWLQNTEHLETLTLPYKWHWKGIDYTLTSNYELQASSNGETLSVEWLSEIFTKLKPTVTLLHNKDTLYIGTYGKDVSADSWIMNTYFGVKIRVNGTLAKTTALKWNYKAVNGDILWSSRSFRMGSLVYDYSDFDKSTGLAYSIDKTGLKADVTLSTVFDVDPTIFESGFETGDLSEWSADSGTPTVQSGVVNSGSYAMLTNASGEYASKYGLTGSTSTFVRFYTRIDALPAAGESTKVACGLNGTNIIWHLYLSRSAGGFRQIRLRTEIPSTVNQYYNFAFSADTWYCFEVNYTQSATGGYVLFLNDTSILARDSVDTSGSTFSRIDMGQQWSDYSVNVYSDDVVVSDSYIGPLAGDSDAPTFSAITSNSTVSGSAFQFSANVTDATAIDFVVPSTNATGSWVNATALDASDAASYTANLTGTLPNTVGAVVSAKFYANDTLGNEGVSSQYNFTVTADSYTVTLSGLTTAGLGETVSIDIAVSRVTGIEVTNWAVNVTNNEGVFLTNYGESTFIFSEEAAVTHTFNVTGLYDVDASATVTPSCTPLSVAWSSGSGGSSGSNDNDNNTEASPSPSPFKLPELTPEDATNIIVLVIIGLVAVVVAVAVASPNKNTKHKLPKIGKSPLGRKST